jgi:hypothetical protein
LLEDQIQQPQRHGGDHARASEEADHRWSESVATFWNPTGRVVELRLFAGVPGAVVELDPIGGFSHDHPDGVQPGRVWLPLDALVVLPSAIL